MLRGTRHNRDTIVALVPHKIKCTTHTRRAGMELSVMADDNTMHADMRNFVPLLQSAGFCFAHTLHTIVDCDLRLQDADRSRIGRKGVRAPIENFVPRKEKCFAR